MSLGLAMLVQLQRKQLDILRAGWLSVYCLLYANRNNLRKMIASKRSPLTTCERQKPWLTAV